MQPERKKQIKTVVVAALLLALFGWLIWLITKDNGMVRVEVEVFPSDASLTIDGQPAKSGIISLTKAKHTFKATRQYFADATKTVDTSNLGSNNFVYLIADANTPEAQAFLLANPQQQALLETLTTAEFSANQEGLIDNYPIISKLPYRSIDYYIEYVVNDDRTITLSVTLHPVSEPGSTSLKEEVAQYKKEVNAFLKENGVKEGEIPISYQDDFGQKL